MIFFSVNLSLSQTLRELEESSKVMQTLDCISGLRNCLKFSYFPLSYMRQPKPRTSPLLLNCYLNDNGGRKHADFNLRWRHGSFTYFSQDLRELFFVLFYCYIWLAPGMVFTLQICTCHKTQQRQSKKTHISIIIIIIIILVITWS